MAITSPGLVLASHALFGQVKPLLDSLKKLGPTDFSADAPPVDIKPGATVKVPVSDVSKAGVYDATDNHYRTGGSTSWHTLTANHYLEGFDLTGVDIDSGVNAERIRQLFSARASIGIAMAVQDAVKTALNGVTASTAVTIPASPTLAQYVALAHAVDWADGSLCALAVNNAELAQIKGVFAAAHLAGSLDEIAEYMGFRSLVLVPGMTARAVIVPASTIGFIGRVPTYIARYVQTGAEVDEDTGLAIGIVVADDQDHNRQIVDADLWFGTTVLSANAGATTKGAIKVGTAV